ncbi:MAG: HD domain-containing protein [Actinomycetota bacterium]
MSEAPTPSETGPHTLDQYLDLRDSLREARRGDGGLEVCVALTAALDGAIGEIAASFPDDVAVVAIGGYGRGELSPYSDVDLMLLHGGGDPSRLAATLFRPLWDAGLRVGHSVRTLDEAAAAAREQVETHTTLLSGRLVAGDSALLGQLKERIASVTRARPLRRHLVAAERERRHNDPYLRMEPDVKAGRGGLRTIHGFEWERRREELIGRFSPGPWEESEEAREVLLQTRNALHAVTGRGHDVFSVDLREPVARWLGLDPFTAAHRLVDAMLVVDRQASRRWPEVVEDEPSGLWSRFIGRPPPLGADAEPSLDELMWILETGERGRHALERLRENGHLDRLLPEWEAVRSLPELAPFHEHPVGGHLWRTCDEMQALIADDGHYGRVAAEVDDIPVLLLASFLHDIGKGRGGDHASVGADIAREFCGRMGVDPIRVELIESAVRLHLLLPMAATRRDIDDPAVIEEVAETANSLRLLQVLYLLAVADSRATGATVWSEWKATLLRTLFLRCAAVFGVDRPLPAGASRTEVLEAVGSARADGLARHVDGMPSEYLRSFTTEEVLWHHELVETMQGWSNTSIRKSDSAASAVIVGRSRPGFRRLVAEAMAANGIDVLEARMHTREDGLVVDSYEVRDDRTRGPVDDEKWSSFRSDLEQVLNGSIDIGAKLASRVAAYPPSPGPLPRAHASIDSASDDLVVTVECSDRIGRLSEILSAFQDCGLDIRLAKLDSREGGVVDSFHVVGGEGGADEGGVEDLERRIADAISP